MIPSRKIRLLKGLLLLIMLIISGIFSINVSAQAPVASFSVQQNSGCIPFSVQFTNTSVNATSWFWDFGNGNFSTSQNPVNIYLGIGSYNVKLVAYNSSGQADSIIQNGLISASSPPVVNFTASATTLCLESSTISFTNQSSSYDSCIWDFGDGSTSNLLNPVHQYLAPGIYTVTLVAYNTNLGCSASLSKNSYIHILSNPAASFNANLTSTCNANAPVTFQAQASSAISWYWNFGDGSTSVQQTPVHVYTQPGIYSVTLVTTNQLGCSDTVVMPQYIEILSNPVPVIQSTTPVSSCAPVLTTFSTNTSNIIAWSWDFGDTTTSQLPSPFHPYYNSGNYPVNLFVTYQNGCTNNSTLMMNATPRPGALYQVQNNHGCSPLTVNFINNSTGNGNTYLWSFGDGSTSTQVSPSHIYTVAGSYTTLLTVTNSYGCSSQFQSNSNIEVSQPSAVFSADNLSGCAPHTVNFSHTGGGVYTYDWDFGDGSTSTQQAPSHIYNLPGSYTVSLTIHENTGCTVSYTLPNPVVVTTGVNNFNPVTPVTACAPFTVNLYDNSPGTSAWAWNFDDGTTSSSQNPVHTFTNSGTFNVSLQTQSTGTTCSQLVAPYAIYVINSGEANFAVNQTLCPPFTGTFTDQSINAVSWLWDFGDGTTSTQQSPVHVYADPGFYNVTLTITTAQGCTYTKFHNYAVTFLPLTANATATTNDTILPLHVDFYANSSGATMWYWEFGDGGTSNLQNPNHVYTVPGPYNINLTISNPECTFTYHYTGVTIGSGNTLPGGVIDSLHVPDPVYSCVPYEMSFTNPVLNSVSWLWDFGDGDTSTLENPVHIYTDPGVYYVSLIAIENSGQIDTIIQPSPFYLTGSTADFQINYTNNCAGSSVNINNNSTNASTYTWDFGDGTTSTAQNPVHTYNTIGINYIISLTTTDTMGCTDFMARSYYAAATSTLSASTRRACANDTVFFNSGYTNFASYLWDFGDGNSSLLANPFHVYPDSGSYQVTLTVTDSIGCSNIWNLPYQIKINKPVASFTFVKTPNGCYAPSVQFTNTSSGGNSWIWDFGDGNLSSQLNPVHYYNTHGTFSVTLTVTNDGCSDMYSINNLIDYPALSADFSYVQSSECLPLTATFTDSSNHAVSWLWDFGDGSTSMQQNPVHIYNEKPNGPVVLSVNDINGCTRSVSKQNINAMYIDINPGDTIGCTPFAFSIVDSSYLVTSWLWNFGDGTYSTDPSPSHTYMYNGNYAVSLTATAPSGCTQVIAPVTFVKSSGPSARFSLNSVVSCAPTIVNFNDNSIGATNWSWNFGDNNLSVLNDPVHIYNQPGVYDITLVVSDSSGCTDSLVRPGMVHITGSIANFTTSGITGCSPWSVQFQDSSISAFNWLWNFGDGNTSAQQNPSHTYTTPGNYVVTLITHDTTGCQSVYSNPVPLNVQQPPVSNFSISNTSGCAPLTVNITNQSTGSVNYKWNFGDGTISNISNPVHTYTTAGTYYISLITGNGTGCKDTMITTVPVVVGSAPIPSFAAINPTGCPPLSVQFTNTSSNTDSTTTYLWNLGNGQITTGDEPAGVYQLPGIYSVTLTAINNGVCSETLTVNNLINVNDGTPPPPVLLKSVSVADTNAIDVTWGNLSIQNLSAYKLYRFNNALATYELIYTDNNPGNSSLNVTSTYIDDHVNTSDSSYTYIVKAVTTCNAELPLEQHVPHTSINLNGSIVNNVVHLQWNKYTGCSTSGYEIYRQDNNTGSFNSVALVDASSDYFIDSTVFCGMQVTYRIRATNLCNEGFEAWSDIVELFAPGILLNQKVDIVRSTVNDDSYVFTEWAPPSIAPQLVTGFDLYRSTDNVNFVLLISLPPGETNYSDYDTQVKLQNYFYKIKVNNVCGSETSPGQPSSSILLNSFLDEENRSNLKWTPYRDWDTGVDYYVIERQDLDGNWIRVGTVNGDVRDYIDR